MKRLYPLFAACLGFLVVSIAVFVVLDRAWATDHDLYGTAAVGKMIATSAAGLFGGGVAALVVCMRRPTVQGGR